MVQGDSEQLHRALLNLLSNASKYTPAGGHDRCGRRTGRRHVRIAISDSGIGIPAEEQPQLFDRFFRASTARENSISGNGLGLAIVKSIVDLHDGAITVESEPRRRFVLHHLPAARSADLDRPAGGGVAAASGTAGRALGPLRTPCHGRHATETGDWTLFGGLFTRGRDLQRARVRTLRDATTSPHGRCAR